MSNFSDALATSEHKDDRTTVSVSLDHLTLKRLDDLREKHNIVNRQAVIRIAIQFALGSLENPISGPKSLQEKSLQEPTEI